MFQCFKKNEHGLDCTFCDQDALEVGRHLGKDHSVPADEIKWGKIWNKVGIVNKVDGTDLRKKWGKRGDSAVKYEQGVFQPAPPTDSEDSWLYKLVGLASILMVLHTNQDAV